MTTMKCAQHAAHNPEFEKTELFRHLWLWHLKILKDPPKWFKVAITYEIDFTIEVPDQYICETQTFNSLRPSAAYMCQWTGSALVQIMACHLIGTKPLSEQMLVYCQMDAWEQISVKVESEF